MRQAGADDDGERAENADPEHDRKLADGVDAPEEQQDDGDAHQRRGDGNVLAGGGQDRLEILREADASRRERERSADENLKEEEKGDQTSRAAEGLPQKNVRAAGMRHLRREPRGEEAVP